MLDDLRAEAVHHVVKHGGVRAAAEIMKVDPAAISRHLARAGVETGLPLFERRGRSMVPTAAALTISEYFEERIQSASSLGSRLEAMRGARAGLVRMGVGEGYLADFVSHPIRTFMDAHPGVRVRVDALPVDDIIVGLTSGSIDIGLAFNPAPADGLKLWGRQPVPVDLVAPAGHPLLRHQDGLTLADVATYPVGLMYPGYGLRKLVQSAEYLEGVKLEPNFETNSLSALRSYLLSGGGVTLLARRSVEQECSAGILGCARMKATLFEESEVHLFTREGIRLMPSVERLLRPVSQHFRGNPQMRTIVR
ncbi:DNA-binding transcriptional regulator, LysR family [Methylobacterium sp. ap11]|jgi:DNA-binding transcriptional LysR family regulator|uniref:LysR family transcriptional regulator n=1 Tax=Methylobacterium sp. ap11 TaxID=1761799 RepID=UPI0008ACFC04|nr:LysR family transcriptional regulator [Methylobacterium sp. ap11]SEP29524.1 DNA-binding transcriptional regulator, LysR family [Methylobacterium sp. ap11]